MTKIDPDMKCAPSKKYTNGSCFTLNSLQEIAKSFNKRNKNKIDINLPKEQLVNTLETKLKDKCSDQTCWLRQDFIKAIENENIKEDIIDDTFRPPGPRAKYEWLSTNHINDVIDQYHKVYPDFLYLGTVPSDFEDLPILGISSIKFDELEKNNKHRIGLVINLDDHTQDGSHWVALFSDLKKNQIYYFDSVGKKPIKNIKRFINRVTKYLYKKKYNSILPINELVRGGTNSPYIKKLENSNFDIRFNNIQHQFKNSECGVYSINFIIRLVSGETFDSVINDITKDDEMNANRKIYFRNVN